MGIRKGRVDGRIYDVVTEEEYMSNSGLYQDGFTAIEKDGLLYPIRKNNLVPGFYSKSEVLGYYVEPLEDEKGKYVSEGNLIDFNDTSNIKDMIEKSNSLRDMERKILCTPNNIFNPKISEDESPEMRGFKEAMIAKNIDIDNYADRWDSNFNNDKRLFNKKTMTLSKLVDISNKTDVSVFMVFKDRSPDVPNPIGKVIEVELTNQGGE